MKLSGWSLVFASAAAALLYWVVAIWALLSTMPPMTLAADPVYRAVQEKEIEVWSSLVLPVLSPPIVIALGAIVVWWVRRESPEGKDPPPSGRFATWPSVTIFK